MRFRQLSLEQGGGSNWVFSVSEDSLGFVWFSGFTGLTRHDGLNNVHYMYRDDNSESLPHNRVYRALPMPGERLLCSLIVQAVDMNYRQANYFIFIFNTSVVIGLMMIIINARPLQSVLAMALCLDAALVVSLAFMIGKFPFEHRQQLRSYALRFLILIATVILAQIIYFFWEVQ